MKIPLPGVQVLKPGVVLELLVPLRPKPKYKFCVFGCVDDPPLYFVINSGINDYIMARKDLLDHQIAVPKGELDSRLYKDSFLDCSQTFDNFSHAEICVHIDQNPGCYMGTLSDKLLAEAIKVARGSLILRPLEAAPVISTLTAKISN